MNTYLTKEDLENDYEKVEYIYNTAGDSFIIAYNTDVMVFDLYDNDKYCTRYNSMSEVKKAIEIANIK